MSGATSRNPHSSLDYLQPAYVLLKCPACLEPLSDPTTLTCGFTVCITCIPSNTVRCPIPRCEHEINLEKIGTDVTVSTIMKELRSISQQITNISEPVSSPLCDLYGDLTQVDHHCVEELKETIECRICYEIFYDPVTTLCGHTFCKECLIRVGYYRKSCPICRSHLTTTSYVQNFTTNHFIIRFIRLYFSELLGQRIVAMHSEKLEHMDKVPLLVSSLAFPQIPCFLTITAPSERIMITRCIESGSNRFGMVLPGRDGAPMFEYGTMLEIKSFRNVGDEKLLINAVGLFRFEVKHYEIYNGYFVANIEEVQDEELEPTYITPTVEELVTNIHTSINFLRKDTNSWLNRINEPTSRMPSDPFQFSFWAAYAIPINEYQKARLLKVTSIRSRLTLLAKWVTELEEQWWRGSTSCNIL